MVVTGQLDKVPLLDVLQVLAHSRQTGVLYVEGSSARGAVVFDSGGVICAHSTTTLELLVKAAKESEPHSRESLRRVQALVALQELLDLKAGEFRFRKSTVRLQEVDGIAMKVFYQAGPMDAGELLLALAQKKECAEVPASAARVADRDQADRPSPELAPDSVREKVDREHARFGPTVIEAELITAEGRLHGHLTNVSLGGAFFHGARLPPVKSVCTLLFTLPGERAAKSIVRVAWSREAHSGVQRGVGLAFDQMPKSSRHALTSYIERVEQLNRRVEDAE